MEMVPALCLIILALSADCSAFPKIEKTNENINADLECHSQTALEAAIGDFSQSMYVHLAQTSGEENFVFSPLSLHSALTLLYLGTKDNSVTQQQLGAAMGIVNNPQLLKMSYQKVIET